MTDLTDNDSTTFGADAPAVVGVSGPHRAHAGAVTTPRLRRTRLAAWTRRCRWNGDVGRFEEATC